MTEQELSLLAQCMTDGTPEPKLIYADWLEDEGRSDLAHAYSWAARLYLHPKMSPAYRVCEWKRRGKTQKGPKRAWELPWLVYDAMPTHDWRSSHDLVPFRLAMQALATALKLMRDMADGRV